MQQQIAELQQAAKQNDRMIRELAAQLQEALKKTVSRRKQAAAVEVA